MALPRLEKDPSSRQTTVVEARLLHQLVKPKDEVEKAALAAQLQENMVGM